ncbi:hypothetical protein CI109_100414 [Kwoniella shandongensis]|uniref:Uncharacterized protein n=1 Tax=Kwoniella shandongensis TaxID=1734106 RepID=A0A5M6C4S4_9TREE|nr:uncharacterized protein CI109_001741 [Kwoniella shandongensis]KAA5529801.1 hypothetical protein CI109_001741 [Kwoniella shandongensis]
MSLPVLTHHDLPLPSSGVTVHYTLSGVPTSPTILLLHGFPSSSIQFNALSPLLAGGGKGYRVISPDLPGFGLTTVPSNPSRAGYEHTFENMAIVIREFIDQLNIEEFMVYGFDYGMPTAFRLALLLEQEQEQKRHAEDKDEDERRVPTIRGIISQNGNAYEEGLSPEFWSPLQSWWKTNDRHHAPSRQALGQFLSDAENLKSQYFGSGTKTSDRVDRIDPLSYRIDHLLNINGQDHIDIQLDLFYDYQHNVALYPSFQRYFRESQVPLLVAWGEDDVAFDPKGAEAYKKDANVYKGKAHLLDGPHFILGTHVQEVAELIGNFLNDIAF